MCRDQRILKSRQLVRFILIILPQCRAHIYPPQPKYYWDSLNTPGMLIHCYRKAQWKFRRYEKPKHFISTPSELIVHTERNRRESEAVCFGKVIRIWFNCLNCWNLCLISKHLSLTVRIFPLPEDSHKFSSLSPQIHCCNASLSLNLE